MALELSTEDKLEYQFHPVNSGSLHFKVRAAHDAHVALTTGPAESDPMYEVFIGGWGNSKSVIRRNRTKPDVAEAETPDVLDAGEFRGFWVRWVNGVVTAGREGEAAAFLTYEDPQPFPVSHYGVCTGWGATGTWQIEGHAAQLQTADKLEYTFHPVTTGCLEFEFSGPSNCHLALTSGARETDPMYEFILGGWENTASVIRYRREQPDKLRVDTPNLMSAGEFRRFCLSWRDGHVQVRAGGRDGPVLMEWRDPNPRFPVSHVGVRTAWGATGRWRLHRSTAAAPPATAAPHRPPPPTVAAMTQPKPAAVTEGEEEAKDEAAEELTGSPAGGWTAPAAGGAACWVDAAGGEVPPNAVSGGKDGDEDLFVGRARHEGALIPGKVVPSHGVCYVAWGGGEHGVQEYQVLCGCAANWVPTQGANVPTGALPAGETEEGEPLFIGRAEHEGTLTIGKVQASHGVCYIPYAGQELGFDTYDVLVSQ